MALGVAKTSTRYACNDRKFVQMVLEVGLSRKKKRISGELRAFHHLDPLSKYCITLELRLGKYWDERWFEI